MNAREAAMLCAALFACGDDGPAQQIDAQQIAVDAYRGACNPLDQGTCELGDKCSWLFDPAGTGHAACIAAGVVPVGNRCRYAADGHDDDCVAGAVCDEHMNELTGRGICREICNPLNVPACGGQMVCAERSDYFGGVSAGLCHPLCNPLTENDFDGSGVELTSSGACGPSNTGCYGTPSQGTAPATAFSCFGEAFPAVETFHRQAPASVTQTSCSQGYQPLLFESTGVTTVVCVAYCRPLNCFSGNCGSNNESRLGQAPHRCNDTDRRGTFDTSAGGEHCQFLWRFEIDAATGAFLPSEYSDALGVCYDHSKYQFDSDGDAMPDTPFPACAQLQDGTGSGSDPTNPLTYFGALDLGCVDSSRMPMMANGERQAPKWLPRDVRVPYTR